MRLVHALRKNSLLSLILLLAVVMCTVPVAAEEDYQRYYSYWIPDTVYIGHPTSGSGGYYEYDKYDEYEEMHPLQWSMNTTGFLEILQSEGSPILYFHGVNPGTVLVTLSDPETAWKTESIITVEPGVVVETKEEADTKENYSRYVQTPQSIIVVAWQEPMQQPSMRPLTLWAEIQDQFENYYDDQILWTSSNPDVFLTEYYSEVVAQTTQDMATSIITVTARNHPELTNSTEVTVYGIQLVPSLWISETVAAETPVNVTIAVTSTEQLQNVELQLSDETGAVLWNATEDIYYYGVWYSDAVQITLTEGVHTLTLTATGGGKTVTNSQTVTAQVPALSITEQNKAAWNAIYGYDSLSYLESSAILGTYFTSDTSIAGVTYTIDFGEKSTDLFGPEVSLTGSTDVDNSSDNMLYLDLGPLEMLGEFPYTLTLGSGESGVTVNGTLTVTDSPVDIKVLTTATIQNGSESGELPNLAVYNREISNKPSRLLEIAVSAGIAGRTIQGLEYLLGYPHGCPEQVTSPMLAAVEVKKYYQDRGLLTDPLNNTVRQSAEIAINNYLGSPGGADAQQINGVGLDNGGWAWGITSTPSLYYTAYPMYGIAVLMKDIGEDPAFWTNKDQIQLGSVDLNKSTQWLKDTSNTWSTSFSDSRYAIEALDAALPYLNDTAAQDARDMLNSSAGYLRENPAPEYYQSSALIGLAIANKTAQDPAVATVIDGYAEYLNKTYLPNENKWDCGGVALAVYALSLLEDERYDSAIQEGVEFLIGYYGSDGRWLSTSTTAQAIRALNTVTETEGIGATPVTITVTVEGIEPQSLTLSSQQPSKWLLLAGAELDGLYGDTPADLSRTITVTKPADLKVQVSVVSTEQMPKSVAMMAGDGYAAIPSGHIDPLATNLTLVVENPGPVAINTEQFISFTGTSTESDQSVMILEIQTTEDKISFNTTKYGVTGNAAEYEDGITFRHEYDELTGKLYVYPGSNDESVPSLTAGVARTFKVPLEFIAAGPATIDARLYPMADDEWMALGDTTVQVTGFAELTISAYDAEYKPLATTEFVLENATDTRTVDSFTGAVYTNASIPAGNYTVWITNQSSSYYIPDIVLNAGSKETYSVYLMQEGPHIYNGNDEPAGKVTPTPTPTVDPAGSGGTDNGLELLAIVGAQPTAAVTTVPTASATAATSGDATTSGDNPTTGSGETTAQQTAAPTAETTLVSTETATATPTETQASLSMMAVLAGLGAASLLRRH